MTTFQVRPPSTYVTQEITRYLATDGTLLSDPRLQAQFGNWSFFPAFRNATIATDETSIGADVYAATTTYEFGPGASGRLDWQTWKTYGPSTIERARLFAFDSRSQPTELLGYMDFTYSETSFDGGTAEFHVFFGGIPFPPGVYSLSAARLEGLDFEFSNPVVLTKDKQDGSKQ